MVYWEFSAGKWWLKYRHNLLLRPINIATTGHVTGPSQTKLNDQITQRQQCIPRELVVISNYKKMKQTTWIKVNHYYNLPMWPFEHTEERAFVTFRGLSLYRGKKLLNARAKWLVYATIRRIYTPNVKCRTRKKHESILVIFCFILTWVYCKLPKIPKITKKCPNCDILGLWLKDAFRNDQYLHFIHTLLSNWYDIIFSFCSRTYLFASIKLWSPKSNESRRKYIPSNSHALCMSLMPVD